MVLLVCSFVGGVCYFGFCGFGGLVLLLVGFWVLFLNCDVWVLCRIAPRVTGDF